MIEAAATSILPREFYTREEFASLMSYSIRTVDALLKSGKIDVHRFGRCVRIPIEEYERFKSEGMQHGRHRQRERK